MSRGKRKYEELDEVDDLREIIRGAIIDMTKKRGIEKTCWPSEIPRNLEKIGELRDWRGYMDLTRELCILMAKDGLIDIEQNKKLLQSSDLVLNLKGIFRIRAKTGWTYENMMNESTEVRLHILKHVVCWWWSWSNVHFLVNSCMPTFTNSYTQTRTHFFFCWSCWVRWWWWQ